MDLREKDLEFFRGLDTLVNLVVQDEDGSGGSGSSSSISSSSNGDDDGLKGGFLHSKTRKANSLIEHLIAESKGSWVRNFYIYAKFIKDGAPNFGKNYLFFRRLRRIIFDKNGSSSNNNNNNNNNNGGGDTTNSSNSNDDSGSVSGNSSSSSSSSGAVGMLQGIRPFSSRIPKQPSALETYLRTHEFDPANVRIGTLTDPAKIRYHINTSKGTVTQGQVVIVRRRICGFDWTFFARIVSSSNNSNSISSSSSNGGRSFAVATVDPLERVCFEVPLDELIFFNNEILNDDDEENNGCYVINDDYGGVLGLTISEVIKARLCELLKAHVADTFHKCGIIRHGSTPEPPKESDNSAKHNGENNNNNTDKFEQEGEFEETVIVKYIIHNKDETDDNAKGMYKCFMNIPKIELIINQINRLLRESGTTEFAAPLSACYTEELLPAVRRALPYVFPHYRDDSGASYACGPDTVADTVVDVPQFVARSLISMKDRCNRILVLLKMRYNEVLDGATKKSITADYLTLIREEVNAYLTNAGFDHTAIPENYVVEPPKDLAVVQKNAEICRSIISSGKDSVYIHTYIHTHIYTHIHIYIHAYMQANSNDYVTDDVSTPTLFFHKFLLIYFVYFNFFNDCQ